MTHPHERRSISSGSPYETPIGWSRAVRIDDRVLVAGTAPVWPDGTVDPDPEVQAERCLEIILAALGQAGASADDVVRRRMFLVDAADAEPVGRAHGRHVRAVRPVRTMVVVGGLLDARWKVEIEAEAVIGSGVVSTGRRRAARFGPCRGGSSTSRPPTVSPPVPLAIRTTARSSCRPCRVAR